MMQTKDEHLFEAAQNLLTERFGVSYHKKKGNLLMMAINIFLKVITLGKMKTFMTRFTTTIGTRVYWGSAKKSPYSRARTLFHEGIHMEQQKRDGRVWFALRYVFSRRARAAYEAEAYQMSNAVSLWRGALFTKPSDAQVALFIGPSYFYMDTDTEHVRQVLRDGIGDVLSGSYILRSPYARAVHDLMVAR